MPPKVFISQRSVDAWVAEDQADVAGPRLTIAGAVTFLVQPASLFLRVAAGTDSAALLGKVKAQPAIAALGGETYMSSVIIGETAYEVEPGFVAEAAADALRALAGMPALPP